MFNVQKKSLTTKPNVPAAAEWARVRSPARFRPGLPWTHCRTLARLSHYYLVSDIWSTFQSFTIFFCYLFFMQTHNVTAGWRCWRHETITPPPPKMETTLAFLFHWIEWKGKIYYRAGFNSKAFVGRKYPKRMDVSAMFVTGFSRDQKRYTPLERTMEEGLHVWTPV